MDIIQTAPIVQQTPAVEAPVVQEMDLIAKVAQFKKSQPTSATPAPTGDNNGVFNYKEIENIKDPVAREYAEKAYKSFLGDYTRKTQALSEERKALETKMQESKGWTAQRIQQELLSNPEFLAAASQIASTQNPQNSGLTDEQFSALTDREKAELSSLKSEINQLKQTNANANFYAAVQAKDSELQTRYPDYSSTQVNEAMESLSKMSPIEVREFVYKAMNHDLHVKDVHEMGRQEGRNLNQDKLNAFSLNGTSASTNDGVPTKNAGENDRDFFLRLGQFRLAQSKKR